MRVRQGAFSLTAVVAFSLSAAHAQSTFQPNWSAWGTANLGVNVLARQQALIHGRNPDAPPASARRIATLTTYRRDPAVTRKVVDGFAGYVARVSGPGKAQAVRDQLARTDPESEWLRLTAPDGFRAGDAGDALASYWVLNWVMANRGDSDARQAAGARAQLRAILPVNPAFARLSETQRQEMAETYMVNFLYQQGSYTEALRRRDAALQQRLSDAAQARFRNEMHLDLRSLALTDRGFVERG